MSNLVKFAYNVTRGASLKIEFNEVIYGYFYKSGYFDL